MGRFRDQAWLLASFANNLAYNILPSFVLKRSYLKLTGTRLGANSCIHTVARFTSLGRITIGQDTTVNYGCLLDARRGIEIGDNVMVGHRCRIYTLGHDLDDPMFGPKGGPVRIGNHAVIFTNVLIMPNVTIGEGAAVMAGSVVTKDVGPYQIVGGNPARYIRDRPRELRYRQRYDLWFGI